MNQNTKKEILLILSEHAMVDISKIKLDSTPKELGLDSLNFVEIIFALEEKFDISIPFNSNDASKSEFEFKNVQTIIEGVEDIIQHSSSKKI